MERCLFMFMIGLLVFSWPLLEIFKTALVPYLYGMWLAYIVILAIVSRSCTEPKNGAEDGSERGRQ